MAILISPLELWLDEENPRFVALENKDQQSIRHYLVSYEDVCQLANEINDAGGLLPGERIVVLRENDKYIVIEGNRRTCALQFLLNRDLIPDSHAHSIPETNPEVIRNCEKIEVDVLSNRDAATALMARRHITGVRQWRPIAKKQFFATRFSSGMSIEKLSLIAGVGQSEIRNDIRDYKFFLQTYNLYKSKNPDFSVGIIDLEIERFLRLFSARFEYYPGIKSRPKQLLGIYYDNQHNTLTTLDQSLFTEIVLSAFEASVVKRQVDTRSTLIDVDGMRDLLDKTTSQPSQLSETSNISYTEEEDSIEQPDNSVEENQEQIVTEGASDIATQNHTERENVGDQITRPGGPAPGGPPPGRFFEYISWEGKLFPEERDHRGLLIAVHELFRLSTEYAGTGRQRDKAYKVFPIAAGMVLRTAYEQALILQMKKTSTWRSYLATLPSSRLPMLSSMEDYVGNHITSILPNSTMRSAFQQILRTGQRDLLNATIHNIGEIQVTSLTLETLAREGMFTLIQAIIDY